MLKIFVLALCQYLVIVAGEQGLTPPYTCTTTTTMCNHGESVPKTESPSLAKYGRPGKRGFPGPKGEKGDFCGCGDGEGFKNLPQPTVGQPVAVKGEKGEPGSPAPTNEKEIEKMRKRIEQLESDVKNIGTSTSSVSAQTGGNSPNRLLQFPKRCSELNNSTTSDLEKAVIYPLISFHDITPYVVNCSGGGWIPIQRRQDGSVNFYRTWRDYADGFGDKDGEFWLGLKNIHRLTSQGPYELYIDMKRRDTGASVYARYGVFFVDNEESKYRLVVGDYSGDYGDRLWYHNGMRFTTHDLDLDENSFNCARSNVGAWWYKSCHHSNLNGQYSTTKYLGWGSIMSFVEMKIRPRC